MYISTRLVGLQGILVATVIGFSCRKYWQFFFCAYSVAVFCRILPYSASYNILFYFACHILPYSAVYILPSSASHILPSSASHILLSSAVDTGRFKRAEDGERVGVIGACWRCRRVLAGLNSSSGVIIVVMRAIRRKKAISNI